MVMDEEKFYQLLPALKLFFEDKTKSFSLVYKWWSVLDCNPTFYASKSVTFHHLE
jgi:hypothetical protein